MKKLVLGSTSVFRRELLTRLQLPFETASPDIDETPLLNEKAEDLVARLAFEKAKKVAQQYTDALIIGADQVGVVENQILGKPLTLENARVQLQYLSGKRIRFYIGMCLLDTRSNQTETSIDTYDVLFRALSPAIIESYLQKEQPLQCAASCKADGLSVTLIEEFNGKDFTALIGLPLISLTKMLEKMGFDPLKEGC